MTDKIFASGKFSEMGAGTEKGQFGLGYDHKTMIGSRGLLIYYDQTDRLP